MADPSIAESIDDALRRPAEIRHLHLHDDLERAVAIDPRIASLPNLTSIYVGSNRSDIEQLLGLEILREVASLRTLEMSLDGLARWPDALFSLRQLEKLSLRGSKIVELPDAIGDLENLRRLDLTLPNLPALPDGIGRLASLKGLFLRGCALSTLPSTIDGLESLEDLFAEGNGLTVLPDGIVRLGKLERLFLGRNRLRRVPDTLAEMPALSWLNLTENEPLKTIPARLAHGKIRVDIEPAKLPAAAKARRTSAAKNALRALEALAAERARDAWLISATPGECGARQSKAGGAPYLAADEPWPACAVCARPMTFMLQIDLGAIAALGDRGLLQLFACRAAPSFERLRTLVEQHPERLEPSYAEQLRELLSRVPHDVLDRIARDLHRWPSDQKTTYEERLRWMKDHGIGGNSWAFLLSAECHYLAHHRSGGERLVRIVDPEPNALVRLAPHDDYPRADERPEPQRITGFERVSDRPSLAELGPDVWEHEEKLTDAERELLDWTVREDKVGGWPFWLQDNEWRRCPECDAPMSEALLTLSGDSDALFAGEWGNGFLYVLRCARHPRRLAHFSQNS